MAKYSQGWIAGSDGDTGALVPFELGVDFGSFQLTGSGGVNHDLLQSFRLCSWAVRLLLNEVRISRGPVDYHLHFPLEKIVGTGPSCRLAFASALLDALDLPLHFPPAEVVLIGDLTLSGTVLPVQYLEHKLRAAADANFGRIIAAADQSGADPPFAVKVRHIRELLVLQT